MFNFFLNFKNINVFFNQIYLNFFQTFVFFKACFANLFISYKFTYYYIDLISKNNISLLILLNLLKKSNFFKFNLLIDIIVIDFFMKKIRFQLIYIINSLKYNSKIFISVFCSEKMPQLSVISIFTNANWYEREVWDLFGIYILNHPDLRRILTDYNFFFFPLRKDFPLSGFFEIFYSDTKKKIISTKISFLQKYRFFDLRYRWLQKIN